MGPWQGSTSWWEYIHVVKEAAYPVEARKQIERKRRDRDPTFPFKDMFPVI